jgi:signal recognition particle receptor subunit beta
MTTIPTFRILVVGGYDTGKSSFIDSLGAKSMETTHGSSSEKSVTFCFGSDSHKAVKVDFVELPSAKFEAQYLEKLRKLPDEFDNIHGVALLFSYADIKSREPCRHWLKVISSVYEKEEEDYEEEQQPIVVVGNKCDLKDDQDPPALFASDVNCYGLIDTDSSSSSSNPLLSPMQVLGLFAEKQWLNKEIDYLVPVSPAPSVGILIPTEESRQMLKPIVLQEGKIEVIGRHEVHTGYVATKKTLSMLKSLSRKHIEVKYESNGTVNVTKLSESPIGIRNSNDRVLHVLRRKNEEAVVPANGRINLYHGEDELTYMVGSFDSFVSRFADSNPLTIECLLAEQNKSYKKHFKLLEAELARISSPSHQARIVELAATNSGLGTINEEFTQLSMIAPDDDDDDDFDDDLYGGETQAY